MKYPHSLPAAARLRALAAGLVALASSFAFSAPNAPTGFVAVPSGTGALFSWNAPAAGEPVASYRVYRKSPYDTSWIYQSTISAPTTVWTQASTTHDPTYSYEYCVAAVNGSGAQGPQSNVAVYARQRYDFVLPWDDVTTSATTDFSALNTAIPLDPTGAGSTGRIFKAGDGTFRVGSASGPQIRFVGVNMSAAACFPTNADAAKVARRMAQFGINLVRLHQMDQLTPKGVFSDAALTTLSTTQMGKLAYFVNELRKNGIYVDMNLHVLRTYANVDQSGADPDDDRLRFKGVDIFSTDVPTASTGMRTQQTTFATQLLTYPNGNHVQGMGTYAKEPVVALIEINNEDGLFATWCTGDLDALTTSYQNELKAKWNSWLTTNAINQTPYADAAALSAAWTAASATSYNSANLLTATPPASGSPASPWQAQIVTSGSANGSMTWVAQNSTGVGSPSGNALKIDVSSADTTNKWHVQALYNSLAPSSTVEHTLTFYGKTAAGDGPRNIRVLLRKKTNAGDASFTTVGIAPFTLTDSWQKFTVAFPATGTYAAGTVSLVFTDFAFRTGTAYLSGFALTAGNTLRGSAAALAESGGTGLLPGESWNNVAPITTAGFADRYRRVQSDWLRFLWETEIDYWKTMKSHLRDTVLAKALIVGTQVQYSPCQLQAEAAMDVIDAHAYWGHPTSFHGAWTMKNRPMAGLDSLTSTTLANCSNRRIIGMPYLVSEYNHPAPGTYGTEGFPIIGAYGAMQGWGGFCAFDYEHYIDASNNIRWDLGAEGWMSMGRAPAKMITLPAARIMQRAQGVGSTYDGSATGTALAAIRKTTFIEKLRQKAAAGSLSASTLSAGHFGVPAECVYTMPIGMKYEPDAATSCDYLAVPATTPAAPYSPAGGELVWRTTTDNKRAEIRTRMSKAVLGDLPTTASVDLGDGVTVTSTAAKLQGSAGNWACFVLTRTDANTGQPFGANGTRWLLTTTGYSDNHFVKWVSGQGPTDADSSVSSFGTTPTLVEVITGSLTFTVPAGLYLHAYSLDEGGDAFGAALSVTYSGSGSTRVATVDLPSIPLAPWYEMYVNGSP